MRQIIGIGLLILAGCGESQYVTLQGQTMGTYYGVQFEPSVSCQLTQEELNDLLVNVNDHMSTYQEDSELSQLNRTSSVDWLGLSTELSLVLHSAHLVWQQSQGAFDVTVGPLVNLWGFGPNPAKGKPSAQAQAEAASRVGMEKLNLRGQQLQKHHPNIYIDLSALAKGRGVDLVAQRLVEHECDNFMVDIGGEMRLAGSNSEGQLWRIGIEVPEPDKIGLLHRVLELTNISIATSGDYRNYREIDGVRVDHVLDPRSGQPAANHVVSTTVLHPEAMMADAYATTLMVLSAQEGLALAESLQLPAYIMTRNAQSETRGEDTFEARYTTAMQPYLSDSVE